MLLGAVFFFRPLSELDTSAAAAAPVIALLVYMGLPVLTFYWVCVELRSSYKAAFVVIAPQSVFIADLALRGERGWNTAGDLEWQLALVPSLGFRPAPRPGSRPQLAIVDTK